MMNVTFYNFSKPTNSTKQITTGGTLLSCELKDNTNMYNPILRIKNINTPIWNYCYIDSFQRYYFVNNWRWVNAVWECDLVCDVLASHKTNIGLMSEYVIRAASESDGSITDIMYPATTDFETRCTFSPNAFTTDLTEGCYIVGIISGGNTNAVGAITYFAMSSAEFGALKQKLFSDDNLVIMDIITSGGQQLVTDISQEVLKTMYNPYQYIVSCIWFPFPKSSISSSTAVGAIKIGWWEYPLSGNRLYAQIINFGESVNIHAHPQAAARGDYLNYAPYTTRTLIGRFGTVSIDNSYFESTDNISISYGIDLITGECRTRIEKSYYDSDHNLHLDPIAERYFMIGVPIQLAQVGTDYLGTAVSAISTVGSALGGALSGIASGGSAIGGAIAGAASGIYNTIDSAMPQVQTGGANGSFLSPSTQTELLEHYYKIVDEDNTRKGRPLCKVRQISTLSGYILIDSPEVDLDCFEVERQEIASYMASGFYYE